MGDKMYLLLLVICLSILHHEVQAQKANLCNITESYFVEITKTETVLAPKKPGGFNLLDMFTGNKYENVTKTVLGVEKRERVVQECCTGFKKRDNECVPIYDTQPSSSTTTTTTTTTTTPAPSSTTSAPPEPPPPPPATEPVTQQTPASVPSEAAPTEPSSSAVAVAEPDPTTQPTAPEPTPAPEVSSPAPSEPAPEPTSTPGTPPPTSSESPATTPEPAPSPEPTSSPETPPASPSEPLGPEAPVQTTSAADTLQQAESIVSEPSSPAQNEPMLSSLIVTTSTTPVTSKPITTPTIVSYSSSESPIPSTQPTPSNDPTTSKQFEKLVTEGAIDSTTILNSRRRRSLDKSDSDSVAAIEILEFESNTLPEDVDELSGSRKADFKLNEKTVSVESHHTRNSLDSDSDDIVVSDLTSDNEDQGYPWIEVLEVLSFGAVVFLLVITVQTSFDSETFSMWRASKKIPQEIDSYGEFWVYDSQGNLEEV